MNTTRRVTAAILALALVAVGAWFLIARPDQARAVSTGVVERKPLEYRLQIDGQVEATRHATISAPVAGRIAEVRLCLDRDLSPRSCGSDVIRDCQMQDAVLDPLR